MTSKKSVLFHYRELVASGELRRDAQQLLAAEKLQSLHNALAGYEPKSAEGGWRERFGLGKRRGEAPMGLYMYGTAGVGKSMLMDMFFDFAPLVQKRRVHFHEFMPEVQSLLKTMREQDDSKDVIMGAAEHIAKETHLLCFDEFHVSNITDAMILGRLFEALLACGVVIVATSNIAPEDLYKDGLQRDRFLPFIDLLKSRFDILHLKSAEDYRLRHLENLTLYFNAKKKAEKKSYADAFESLTGKKQGEPCKLSVGKRSLSVPEAIGQVCRFDFTDLCGKALGASDYMVLAEKFRIVFLTGVPIFTNELRNEMKRFITLIDVFYENKTVLFMTSDGAFADLGQGRDHAFEFQRTYSRLEEMRSAEYSKDLVGPAGFEPATNPL